MNAGKPIDEMLAEVKRQRDAKRDFIVPAGKIAARYSKIDGRNEVLLDMATSADKKEDFLLTSNGNNQLAQFLGIPRQYYDRMAEKNPELLVDSINSWLSLDPEPKRLVRTLDNRVRALLSDRYATYDNYPLALMALKLFKDHDAKIRSAHIDENKIYFKATVPTLRLPDPGIRRVGQFMEGGVVVSNSEVGLGSVRVDPMAYLLACLNGMIGEHALRKRHLGRRHDVSEDAYEVLTDQTKQLTEGAFWSQVNDVLNSSFNPDHFAKLAAGMQEAAEREVPKGADIPSIVEVTVKNHNLPLGLKDDILDSFIREGDLSQFGLMNAVTNVANNQDNYETSTHLEKAGGKIIDLKPSEWEVLTQAKL